VSGERKESVAVVGAGAWGTAFAAMLAGGHESVTLWAHETEVCSDLRDRRENPAFLPGIALPPGIRPTNDLAAAVSGKTVVVFAVPSHHLREIAVRAAAHLSPEACLVSLAKGVENGTLKRMTEVLAEAAPKLAPRVAALSGPTFAREVAEGKPTGATVAARDLSVARRLQQALSGSRFRLYADDDVTGVEIGGALKNVMAIAAGMADGLGFGHNARALLITRGLAEISRLGVRLGAHPQTFSGSRGWGPGPHLHGRPLPEPDGGDARGARGEDRRDPRRDDDGGGGVRTAVSAVELSRRTGVPMPISEQVHGILHEGKDVREAVNDLFSRALKREKE